MDHAEIEARLQAIAQEFSKPGSPPLQRDDELSGRFDSLTILEMVFRFEDAFGIEIDTAGLHELKTFGQLVDAVQALIPD